MAGYSAACLEVLDHLRVPTVIVAGISMGGYIAMQMIRDAPSRIGGLILIDTRERADSDPTREDRYKTIAEIEKRGTAHIIEALLPKMVTTEAAREPFRRLMMTATAPGMIAALRAMASRPDSTATLRSVIVPTLIVAGDRDSITPLDDADRMVSLVPGAMLAIIPNAAHASNFDQPEAFNGAVTDFLDTNFGSN